MTSFEFEIDEKSRVGSEFMSRVAREVRRAVAFEKSQRKLTQQSIADKIGTSRAVVNREISGLENLTSRRIGELLWAVGWEPYFEARKIEKGNGTGVFRFEQKQEQKPHVVETGLKRQLEIVDGN